MRFITAFLLLLLFIPGRAATATLDTSVVRVLRTQTLRGMEYAYNFDFVNANRAYDQAITVEPSYPRPYLGKASIVFWNLLLDKRDSTYDKFLSMTDDIIERADTYIDKYGKNADVLTTLGTAYGYRAFAHGRMKSYFKAAWDGKKSYDSFQEALALDHNWYDAYAGLGVYHYFSSFIPKSLQWVVGILGVQGDSELGIRELKIAMQRGIYMKTDAKYFLVEFLPWHEDNFDASEAMLRDLNTAYPKNTLVSFTLAIWQLKRNDAVAARTTLQKIATDGGMLLPGLQQFVTYKLGECNFRLMDYASARENYRSFLSIYHDENYTATANYRMGLCTEMAGGRSQALPFYRAASKAPRKFGDDAYAARKSDLLLNQQLSTYDTLLLRAQALFHSGKYDKAIAEFNALRGMAGAPKAIAAEAEYDAGEVLFEMKKYREALEHYKAVGAMRFDPPEKWLSPWSHYRGGVCLARLNEKQMAKAELEKALEYDEYDFDNWVNHRTHRELDALKK